MYHGVDGGAASTEVARRGRRIVEERERTCDEEMLRQGCEPKAYPEGVGVVFGISVAYFPGVSGGNLKKRIEAIMNRRFAPRLTRAKKLLLAGAGIVAVMGPMAIGLLNAPALRAQARADLRFEVASVKPSNPQERVVGLFTYPGGRIVATNYTLKMLIHEAYQIGDRFILGGAAWTGQTRFSLNAIPPADSASAKINPANPKLPPPAEELAMLRNLLAERFHLKVREETREGDVYTLTIDRAGHKLKVAADPTAFPYLGTGGTSTRPGLIRGANADMRVLTEGLMRLAGRPVLNLTGLEGSFDIEFEYARDLSESPLPSLSGALLDLGLRLTPAKGPVQSVHIEEAEPPTEN